MGKSRPPPPPDYAALAAQQGAANRETAIESWRLNNSPISTPYGQRNLVADPNSPSGYRIEETMNEQDLANLNAQRALSGQLLTGIAPQAMNTLQGIVGSGINTQNLPAMVSGVDTRGLERLNFNIPGGQYGFNRGQVQGNVSFDGLNPMESGEAVRNRVEQNMMDKWNQRNDPRMAREQDALTARIANMGGNTSSRAARTMRQELSQNQNDARTNATYDAVLRGGEEAQRQFGMGLQGRQQGVSETMQQAGFRNQAQQQDFAQLGQLADLWNSTRGQDAALQAQQAGFNNTAVQQNIANMFNNASLQNSSRAQGISELANLRQMPLNEIMAMLSGTQVNAPNFQGPAQTQWQAAPIYQAGQDQYAANVANNNARNAQRAAPWNALGSVASAWAGSGFGFSDRRLKHNVTRIGTTPGGVPVYVYEKFGRTEIGVMADEVPADARTLHPSGFWMVDYSKVR